MKQKKWLSLASTVFLLSNSFFSTVAFAEYDSNNSFSTKLVSEKTKDDISKTIGLEKPDESEIVEPEKPIEEEPGTPKEPEIPKEPEKPIEKEPEEKEPEEKEPEEKEPEESEEPKEPEKPTKPKPVERPKGDYDLSDEFLLLVIEEGYDAQKSNVKKLINQWVETKDETIYKHLLEYYVKSDFMDYSLEYDVKKQEYIKNINDLKNKVSKVELDKFLYDFHKMNAEYMKYLYYIKDYDLAAQVNQLLILASELNHISKKDFEDINKDVGNVVEEVTKDEQGPTDDQYGEPTDVPSTLIPGEKDKDNNTHFDTGKKRPDKKPTKLPPIRQGYDSQHKTYNNNGKFCTVTIKSYKDGKLIKTETRNPIGVEKMSCLASSTQEAHAHAKERYDKFLKGQAAYVSPFSPEGMKQRYEEMNKLNSEKEQESDKETGITIQYTLNKNETSPYYHDTGLSVLKDNKMDYELVTTALHTIAIQSKGKFFRDEGKVLAIIEGQVVRIFEFEGLIEFKEFEKNFELTRIGVKAQDKLSGTNEKFVDLVEIERLHTLIFKGKEKEFSNPFVVENNQVLLPVIELIDLIEGTTSTSGNSLNINVGEHKISLGLNNNKALINNKEVVLSTKVKQTKDGVVIVPYHEILSALGFEIVIDNKDVKIEKLKEKEKEKELD